MLPRLAAGFIPPLLVSNLNLIHTRHIYLTRKRSRAFNSALLQLQKKAKGKRQRARKYYQLVLFCTSELLHFKTVVLESYCN